ncbi:hypothetical protein [Rhodopila sp.]|jgi:hypothetical protein|uniref:hypothetical protein n=1 Tax=Rhodopila sp. TaxID=2480087 RepID=UPI002BBB671B|nr:hypothetical protein [Rhodopila sp.]HVZ07318.1 hypothetical protein [Rhodopila sp.]
MAISPLTEVVLRTAFRRRLLAPDADSGMSLLMAEAADVAATPEDWRGSVASAVAAGLVYDPVRLPEGALQCHWHLELTPQGVAAVRALKDG